MNAPLLPTTPTKPAAAWGAQPPAQVAAPAKPAQPAPPLPAFGAAPPASRPAPMQPKTIAPALPAAPAAPAQPQQPQPPQMVPAYLAKAMERQKVKADKENAMVPVPGATGATPAEALPTRTGVPATTASAATTAAPTQNAANDAAAAAENTAALDQTAHTEAAAANAEAASSIPPSGITPPAETDPPEKVKQKTEAEQTFADLMEQAKAWMTAKEDPASKLAFSRAIIHSALVNQEAMNAAKAAVAGNPALSGQPAGDAYIAYRAGQLGMEAAELKSSLAIAEQRAVQELNSKGFDAVFKLNEIRKSDDEKNLATYGSVLDEMIKGGADEASLTEYFNDFIKPGLPNGGVGMTLDMFRNPGTRAQLLNAHQSETRKLFRESIKRGDDLASIRQLLDAAYTPEQIASVGKDWMTGKSLEEVNAALTGAGYDPIEDLSDLIDNEDMLGEAVVINNTRKEANALGYQDEIDDTLQSLTAQGYELTPELERQVSAYISAMNTPGFDPEDSTPPWKNDATAHLWDSWPLPGQSEFGNTTIDDTPSTHFIYERNAALDNGWEKYVRETPEESRLSRKDWYAALDKEFPGLSNGTETTGKIKDVLDAWRPPKKNVEAGDRVLAAKEGEVVINDAVDNDTWKTIDWTDPNVLEYKRSLPPLSDKDVTKALVAAGAAPVVKINGKVYRTLGLDNVGGGVKNDYIRMQDEAGNIVWIKNGTGTPLTALPKSDKKAVAVQSAVTRGAR